MSPGSLPPILSPALLQAIKKEPHLPHHTFYFIAAATLTILNRPDEIPKVYKYAIEQGPGGVDALPEHSERLRISRRIREALIKTAAVGGVPKTINALLALKQVTPEELQDDPFSYSPTSRRSDIYDIPSSQILRRGQAFFDMVYGKISKRVMGQMDRSGTEDLGLIARLMYGHILSNTTMLNPVETSYVLIAGLIPQDVNPQLKGHLRGAINGGAAAEEVQAVRQIVCSLCQAAGMKMIDESVVAGWGWREDVANLS